MSNITRTFRLGRMNKQLDERLVPQDEYIDALNIRVNSSEGSEAGTIENATGNELLVTPKYKFQNTSIFTKTIGAYADSSRETLYWFLHDPLNATSGGVVDMIVSYNVASNQISYHVVSTSVLNFNPQYLITGVSMVDDLLFFTDNYNPPRKINVKRFYPEPDATHVDLITAEDINVIVTPPALSPSIKMTNTAGGEDFLELRFVSFAYRYRYLDGEYSALSPFSEVAFIPKAFSIDTNKYLNGGMKNRFNTALVTFNTGGNNVVGVDLCFKYADDDLVRVIDKYDKYDEGWPNDSSQTIAFTNKKIYTVLPDSEILRLYDNVPLLAKAQTLMGNRLMYGNYVEGFDLKDSFGVPIRTNFYAKGISDTTGLVEGQGFMETTQYTIYGGETVTTQGAFIIDFSDLELTAGSIFAFNINVFHDDFSGPDAGLVTAEDGQEAFTLSFTYTLTENYTNGYQLVNSPSFQSAIGIGNTQNIVDCGDGFTLNDELHCSVVPPAGYVLNSTGFTSIIGELGFKITVTTSQPNLALFTIPALAYADSEEPLVVSLYEYLRISNVEWAFQSLGDLRSLHSNRDYEVGIVYMDEYNRASTAIVSGSNAVHFPASASDTVNRIRVTIPSDMTPPAGAVRYRFVLKPTEEDYDVVYTSFYYLDPTENALWMRLDGDNQRKVEVGDELIVKADANGPLNTKRVVSVLEKQPFMRDEIVEGSLPGIYIRVNQQGFTIDSSSTLQLGCDQVIEVNNVISQGPPAIAYDLHDNGDNWAITAGSEVKILFDANRENRGGCGDPCGAMRYYFEVTRIASQDYVDFADFWVGENINLNDGETDVDCADSDSPVGTTFQTVQPTYDHTTANPLSVFQPDGGFTVQFVRSSVDDRLTMCVFSGISACAGFIGIGSTNSKLEVKVCVTQAKRPVIFETLPQDAQPDIFFESSDVYVCDSSGHEGNVQNQVLGATPGIVDLDFFNCFCFGNGVESYKAQDAMEGHYFRLGQRVTSTSSREFRRIRRFADITYSGIYNDESNVNKLNEFNLGLVNYKALEDSYGHIQRLEGRDTNILCLQEDKVSYVMVGKNILSDAGGGSALVSVPDVLGQQLARTEEYGISYHPESYAEYGFDKYFTDAKRGVVLRLSGSGVQEQMVPISSMGMSPYFRQLFIDGMTTQKLGGYDPYMNEYVLAPNSSPLPIEEECFNCGRSLSIQLTNDRVNYCFNTGGATGILTIGINPSDTVTILLSHGSNSATSTFTSFGNIFINVEDPSVESYTITLSGSGTASFVASCPKPASLQVRVITITSNSLAGQTTQNEYYWVSGTYTSPSYTSSVVFDEGGAPFVVSQYQAFQSLMGQSSTPQNNSTLRVVNRKVGSDSFDFDYQRHRFYAIRTDNVYDSDVVSVALLLQEAQNLQPINISNSPISHYGEYEVGGTGAALYIIYDYRDANEMQLCIGERLEDACCGCALNEVYPRYTKFEGSTAKPLAYADTICNETALSFVYYHTGGQNMPQIGDRVFSDFAGANTVDWRVIKLNQHNVYIKTGSNGVIYDLDPCAAIAYTIGEGSYDVTTACAATNTFSVFSGSGVINVGYHLYLDINFSAPLQPGYYKYGSSVLEIGPYGEIIDSTLC